MSALIVLIVFGVYLIAILMGRSFNYRFGLSRAGHHHLFILYFVMFVSWIVYGSEWVFESGIRSMLAALGFSGFSTPWGSVNFLAEVTTATGQISQSRFALMVYCYYGVVLVWGIVIGSSREFWRRIRFEGILPALVIIPLSFTLFTGIWTITRLALIASPFIAWFLAEHIEVRKYAPVMFVVALLLYSFVLHYHAEAVRQAPSTEYTVSRFIADRIPESTGVAHGVRYGPDFRSLANVVEGPRRIDYLEVSEGRRLPSVHFDYAVISDWRENRMTYYWGEPVWDSAMSYLSRFQGSVVYSDGFSQIYAY